ncbi:MAG: transglutaminase-like domain-containing protein [Sphaerochaeta sp.]|nr:transglutaminase-like domain-containing protein [Sphaerochaeta sp.]
MNEQLTYLEPSHLLDYIHPTIQELITSKGWDTIKEKATLIGEVYTFVRDQIAYGYTKSFALPASKILKKGYGNCITKSTLLMALLRGVGVPCRFHTMTIRKIIFRGLLPKLSYKAVPKRPFHAWVEVLYNNKWLALEGHIIDTAYLTNLQRKFPDYMGSFYGYGIAVLNFRNPPNKWNNTDTYVQNEATEEDLGIFDTPDDFFTQHPESEAYTQSFRYRVMIRRHLNKSIRALRDRK